jgi:hypothetical protein
MSSGLLFAAFNGADRVERERAAGGTLFLAEAPW